MEIEKNKNIRIKLTWFSFAAIALLTTFCFFWGWTFEVKDFMIFVAIVMGEFIFLWLLCFLLIKFNKQNYKIDIESIILLKNNQEVFSIQKSDIIQICYIRFSWILLAQLGSGYLSVIYRSETEDKKFSTIIKSNAEKIHSISMSLKQAQAVSKILNLKLKLK